MKKIVWEDRTIAWDSLIYGYAQSCWQVLRISALQWYIITSVRCGVSYCGVRFEMS